MTKQGKVYLIGAGPGDPGLLSIKAMECLQTADAVVYDRLADPRILAYAKDDAEMVYVGKASANHTMRQPDINKLLVKLAAEGKTVARLKGGDPFVFGRGGEEAIELLEAGLPFEFVPGVTSAIAVAEYAGIPVTHRHVATSFAVITGHEDPTKGESTINWSGLATAVDTLVFLMGVENLTNITKNLIANGRSADTPAAVIRWGTKPEQRTLITTVGTAAADVAAANLKPPAIFIVGNVVKLREQKLWGIISLIRSVYPRRVSPAAARIIASIWPSSSFRRRVSTLPRKSTIFRSGRAAKSWALRRRLEVPITAPCGSVSIEAYLLLTKASPALARLVTAVRHRPSGRTVGISFRLWTARSISPSRRAVSSSLVKSPLPPILASGTSRIRSPLVMIFFKVTVHSGYCLRRRSAI